VSRLLIKYLYNHRDILWRRVESEYLGLLKTRKLLKNRHAQKSKNAEIAPNWNVSRATRWLRTRIGMQTSGRTTSRRRFPGCHQHLAKRRRVRLLRFTGARQFASQTFRKKSSEISLWYPHNCLTNFPQVYSHLKGCGGIPPPPVLGPNWNVSGT
jgi:hypothetical protein